MDAPDVDDIVDGIIDNDDVFIMTVGDDDNGVDNDTK